MARSLGMGSLGKAEGRVKRGPPIACVQPAGDQEDSCLLMLIPASGIQRFSASTQGHSIGYHGPQPLTVFI